MSTLGNCQPSVEALTPRVYEAQKIDGNFLSLAHDQHACLSSFLGLGTMLDSFGGLFHFGALASSTSSM